MSINAIGGSNPTIPTQVTQPSSLSGTGQNSFAEQLAATTHGGAAVLPHEFKPSDPLNQYLTNDDRATIASATGISIAANGSFLIPVSMGVNQSVATMDAVGQVAANRANGSLTGPLSVDALNQMAAQFTQRIAANQDPFGDSNVDTSA